MKKISAFAFLVILINLGYSQMIQVTTGKTSSLVFPYAITHVDRGTKDILIQTVKEAGNILMIKAASTDFSPTNLSVVTADGCIYAFPVVFVQDPTLFVYQIEAHKNKSLATLANGVLDNPPIIGGISDENWDIYGSVTGIYIKDNLMYYQIAVHNNSPIDYDNDFIRFYIRDKKKGKRTAIQEDELKPVFEAGSIGKVKAGTRAVIVGVFEKFTLPDGKFLAVEINEKNGGRHLFMKVKNNKIMKAITLPDLK